MALQKFQNTVGGRLQPARNMFESFDPYTGKPWALIPLDGPAEVEAPSPLPAPPSGPRNGPG